ncbi:hypothetical protein INT43_005225 [Umbelopsis isabellina]|uniref:Cas12f1-like TNB domain-containing protein n=1 Tax=Mortierella isabellina TaxID=91625 RepID=A0A8H7PH89_MORIS|nr:hypothetical protein INT43_005225 [Umbelopsis isabellina]
MQGPGPQYWKSLKFEMASKSPIIAFGNALFGSKNHNHLKGQPVGVVGVLWKMIKRREKMGNLVVIPIDEYLTSQEGDNCRQHPHHSIVVCKNCKILWQRGVNASKNMLQIARSVWAGNQRPTVFARPPPWQQIQEPPHIAATNAVSSGN